MSTHKLLLPLCRGYGAHLNAERPAEWRSTVQRMFDAARRESSLLGPDVQVLDLDTTWLAAALGCRVRLTAPFAWIVEAGLPARTSVGRSDRLRAALEDPVFRTQREALVALLKRGQRMAAAMPGPWTLARQVAYPDVPVGAEWEEMLDATVLLVSNVARSILDTGTRDLLFWERLDGGDASAIPEFYGGLYNVVAHYQARAWVAIQGGELAQAGLFRHPAVSAVLFPELAPDALLAGRRVDDVALGVGIPPELFAGCDDLERRLTAVTQAFYDSPASVLCPLVPHDAVPENVIRLVAGFRRVGDASRGAGPPPHPM
jgi:hypothetical protein